MEDAFEAKSNLVESSGGVFEVEDNNVLIYSKKKLGRFPEDNEIAMIIRAIDRGVPLEEAQDKAAEHAPKPPSFDKWLVQRFNSLVGKE